MPAAKAYRAKTVTYKGTAITGINDVSINESGSSVDLTTDASAYVQAVFVDQIAVDVTVNTTDIDRCASIVVGDIGALVVTFQLRAEGSGAGVGDEVATMSTAVCTGKTPQAGTNGIGSVALTFRCSGPSAHPTTWS